VLAQTVYASLLVPCCLYAATQGFRQFVVMRASFCVVFALIHLTILRTRFKISPLAILSNLKTPAIASLLMGAFAYVTRILTNGVLLKDLIAIALCIVFYVLLLSLFPDVRSIIAIPIRSIRFFLRQDAGRILPDKAFLSILYRIRVGRKLNWKTPVSFNEKLQWLKLHNRKPEYTAMVDKYAAREYIANKAAHEYLVPLLGVWDRFEDIDFSKLPEQFVLKCTHDSGSVFICKDRNRFDLETVEHKMRRALKKNYYYYSREWPYKHVTPRIIAEQYMQGEWYDYKLFCFHGKVKCTYVTVGSASFHDRRYTFFDNYWNIMPFCVNFPRLESPVAKPHYFAKMVAIAESVSKDIPFLRVDFFEIQQKLYIGELTFYPEGGFGVFQPYEYDELLGSWLAL
jgi:hypothetical protein